MKSMKICLKKFNYRMYKDVVHYLYIKVLSTLYVSQTDLSQIHCFLVTTVI